MTIREKAAKVIALELATREIEEMLRRLGPVPGFTMEQSAMAALNITPRVAESKAGDAHAIIVALRRAGIDLVPVVI